MNYCIFSSSSSSLLVRGFFFANGKNADALSPRLGVFAAANVWFSQPFRSLVRQRGRISTCPERRNAAAVAPLPFSSLLWAFDSLFMRRWWAGREIGGEHTLLQSAQDRTWGVSLWPSQRYVTQVLGIFMDELRRLKKSFQVHTLKVTDLKSFTWKTAFFVDTWREVFT